jgi:hypothetical protein
VAPASWEMKRGRNQRMSLTEHWTGFWKISQVLGQELPALCETAFCASNRFERREIGLVIYGPMQIISDLIYEIRCHMILPDAIVEALVVQNIVRFGGTAMDLRSDNFPLPRLHVRGERRDLEVFGAAR